MTYVLTLSRKMSFCADNVLETKLKRFKPKNLTVALAGFGWVEVDNIDGFRQVVLLIQYGNQLLKSNSKETITHV